MNNPQRTVHEGSSKGTPKSKNGDQIEASSEVLTITSGDGKVRLKRQLGVGYGVAIIIGLVAGGGIYITPQEILRNVGSPGVSLLMWACGGILTLISALCFAEIGVHFPMSGERYAYLNAMYGSYLAFIYLWQYNFLQRPGSNAIKAIMFGRYLFKPFYPDCEVPPMLVCLAATLLTILFCGINCRNVKFVAKGQSLLTSLSVAILVLIIVIGIYTTASGDNENLSSPFENSTTDSGNLIIAFCSVVFSYGGWSALNFLTEEVKNVKTTLPASIIISCFVLTILYTMVNFSYFAVLGRDEVLASDAIGVSLMLKVWTPLAWVMSIAIAVSVCSSFNSGLLVGSRLTCAAAHNGHLPRMLSFININHAAPVIAVIFQVLLTLLYVWFGNVTALINSFTFVVKFLEMFVAFGYIRIRFKTRNDSSHDKFKIPIVIHIIFAGSVLFMTLVNLVSNFAASSFTLLLLVGSSSLFHVVFIMWRPTFVRRNKTIDNLNDFIQKLFYCAPAAKNV